MKLRNAIENSKLVRDEDGKNRNKKSTACVAQSVSEDAKRNCFEEVNLF